MTRSICHFVVTMNENRIITSIEKYKLQDAAIKRMEEKIAAGCLKVLVVDDIRKIRNAQGATGNVRRVLQRYLAGQ